MASTDESTTTSTTPLTVIPEEPEEDESNWFETNPILASAVIVCALIAIAFVVFWMRNKKRNSNKEQRVHISRPVGAITPGLPSNPVGFSENFVFFSTPTQKHSRTEHSSVNISQDEPPTISQTLASQPEYMLSHRKSSSIGSNQRVRKVGVARLSTTNLEIPVSHLSQAGPTNPGTPSAEQPPPPGFILSVPMVYRRISYNQQQAVYAPEHVSSSYPGFFPTPNASDVNPARQT